MPKFFVREDQIQNNQINIIGGDINHIKNVLRLNSDDELQVCCIEQKVNYICKIIKISDDKVLCDIISKVEKSAEPSIYINMFQGLPKSDKMELIIEKCTEIGVSEFTPVEMKRCVVKLDENSKSKKVDRWQKIAEVAAKQSGRDIIPKVNNVINIKNMYQFLEKYDIVLVAYEKERENSLKQVLSRLTSEYTTNVKIAVVIGPEGGIEQEEIDVLIKCNANIVTLGTRILRTETAPIVITSNLIYEFE